MAGLYHPCHCFRFILIIPFAPYQIKSKRMAHHLISLADLQQFKTELLTELTRILTSHAPEPPKQWLKSYECETSWAFPVAPYKPFVLTAPLKPQRLEDSCSMLQMIFQN